jgi:hypothetical protein
MPYQLDTRTVSPQLLAAVRRRVRPGEVGNAWRPALDLVWEFLGRHKGLRSNGHNCFLYQHPAPGDAFMVVDFGVQVVRSFQAEGEVLCAETPAGEVVMTTHIGSYGKLGAAHQAIRSWSSATGRMLGACSWEIYGDWTDDETKLETQVIYLLS